MKTITLKGDDLKLSHKIACHEDDEFERMKILTQFNETYKMLAFDLKTRRCVAVFTTQKDGQLSYSCPTLIHLIVRANKLHIVAYFRSLNLAKNLDFDKDTLRILMTQVISDLQRKDRIHIKRGSIRMIIGCPHEL